MKGRENKVSIYLIKWLMNHDFLWRKKWEDETLHLHHACCYFSYVFFIKTILKKHLSAIIEMF